MQHITYVKNISSDRTACNAGFLRVNLTAIYNAYTEYTEVLRVAF